MKKTLSILLLGLLYLLSFFPLRALYILAYVLFLILNNIVKYRKKIIDQNLLNAFPEKSPEERLLIRKKYYRYLADLMVEAIKLLTINNTEVSKRVKVANPELISRYIQRWQKCNWCVGPLWKLGNEWPSFQPAFY